MNLYDVHFEDEKLGLANSDTHPFGAGHRRILVVKRGPKWSSLLDIDTAMAAEMFTDTFERMKPRELLMLNFQELAVRLRRLSNEYGNNSAIYREAMEQLGYPVPKPEKSEAQVTADGEKVKRMHAAKAAKVVVAGTGEVPGQNEGSGLFIRRLWMTGNYTPERIVELVLVSYPGRTTKKSDVYWNYKKLLELGTPNVPPWPEKPKKEPKPVLKAEVIKPALAPKRKPDPEPKKAPEKKPKKKKK